MSCSVTYAWRHGQNLCFHTTGRIVMLSLVCQTESKMEVPLTLAVVAARHPLLDGHTHQVLLCVPVKELMRSGKHSERERYLQFIPDFSVFHCGASVARVKC